MWDKSQQATMLCNLTLNLRITVHKHPRPSFNKLNKIIEKCPQSQLTTLHDYKYATHQYWSDSLFDSCTNVRTNMANSISSKKPIPSWDWLLWLKSRKHLWMSYQHQIGEWEYAFRWQKYRMKLETLKLSSSWNQALLTSKQLKQVQPRFYETPGVLMFDSIKGKPLINIWHTHPLHILTATLTHGLP